MARFRCVRSRRCRGTRCSTNDDVFDLEDQRDRVDNVDAVDDRRVDDVDDADDVTGRRVDDVEDRRFRASELDKRYDRC